MRYLGLDCATKIRAVAAIGPMSERAAQRNEAPIAVGAGEPTHALTALGLMDEFWFWVSPSLWPAGPRIFDDVGPVRPGLIGSTTSGSGVVRLAYRPAPTGRTGQAPSIEPGASGPCSY